MPAAGLSPLRVGPEDVTAAEAGELVKKVGVHNQAKGLIQATAKQMPKDLRVIAQRFEHQDRSRLLNADEVQEQAEVTVGEDTVGRVLSARVKGPKEDPLASHVLVLYETEEGRTARCAIGYSTKTFPKSLRAFDAALADGSVTVNEDNSDLASVQRQLDTSRAETERLAKEAAEEREKRKAIEAGTEPPAADPAAAEQGVPEDQIPDGVIPGETPGWPLINGIVVDLPDEVREKLAAAELATDETPAAPEAEAPAPETVEAPTGNAKDLIAAVGDYSDAQLIALLAAEKAAAKPRSTVEESVEAEQKKRRTEDAG